MRLDAGDAVNVAAAALSVHTGTHVDGALHVLAAGAPAAAQPLETFIGPARVLDARRRPLIDDAALDAGALRGEAGQRLLFRTRDRVDAEQFPAGLAPVDPALVPRLVAAGVRLVGTDAPSVDPIDSKALPAHHALLMAGIAIVENLVLDDVAAGDYTLIVLPLRLMEADSSPARAVLLAGAASWAVAATR
jgi:arylformamidase